MNGTSRMLTIVRTPRLAAMKRSRVVGDLILFAGLAAYLLATVRTIAALPDTLHDAGIVVPVVWQDVAARP